MELRKIKVRSWDKDNKRMLFGNALQGIGFFGEDGLGMIGTSHTLMQYTGLKDKNGKEIYEGDIWKGQKVSVIEEVRWLENMARFNIEKNKIDTFGIEILGNIYENPELIKQ